MKGIRREKIHMILVDKYNHWLCSCPHSFPFSLTHLVYFRIHFCISLVTLDVQLCLTVGMSYVWVHAFIFILWQVMSEECVNPLPVVVSLGWNKALLLASTTCLPGYPAFRPSPRLTGFPDLRPLNWWPFNPFKPRTPPLTSCHHSLLHPRPPPPWTPTLNPTLHRCLQKGIQSFSRSNSPLSSPSYKDISTWHDFVYAYEFLSLICVCARAREYECVCVCVCACSQQFVPQN